MSEYILKFEQLSSEDVPAVGGKNASLGEMINALTDEGIRVPHGFAVTATAYRDFLAANELEGQIEDEVEAWQAGKKTLREAGVGIRRLFRGGEFRKRWPRVLARPTPNSVNATTLRRLTSPCAAAPRQKICLRPVLPDSKRLS